MPARVNLLLHHPPSVEIIDGMAHITLLIPPERLAEFCAESLDAMTASPADAIEITPILFERRFPMADLP